MEFRCVKGFEGLYEISDEAVVRSLDRYVDLPDCRTRFYKSRIITPRINNCGYVCVRLSKNGFTWTHFIHRLVAEAFIPNPFNLPQVNHLKSKLDNTPNDLAWSSVSENTLHSYKTGLNSNQGGNHSFAVGVIDNEIGAKFLCIKDWCIARGINYNTGRNILSGCNSSDKIDTSKIIKFNPRENGEIASARESGD